MFTYGSAVLNWNFLRKTFSQMIWSSSAPQWVYFLILQVHAEHAGKYVNDAVTLQALKIKDILSHESSLSS